MSALPLVRFRLQLAGGSRWWRAQCDWTQPAENVLRLSVEAIVLTAYATVPNVVNSLRGGAYDFVSKPFTVRDLLPRLRAGIEKSELRGQVALHEASRALIGARSRVEVAGLTGRAASSPVMVARSRMVRPKAARTAEV